MTESTSLVTNWTSDDDEAVQYLRALAADAVQKVGNGHPGTAMALAPAATLLFQHVLRHDPSDATWLGRDRFVLSAGHSSLTLYSQLFLSGYGLTLDDLARFRTWGARTPGHPEHGHTVGVETTTGPLGQGLATAVGMAMAARYERGIFDPDAPLGTSPFDHNVWVIASDGDLQEGITSEASSLAGTQALGNLCVIWDDNRISIEGDTAVAFTEDVVARYRAYGWQVAEVDMRADGSADLEALIVAVEAARAETTRPSFIRMRTTIAWPAPLARGTAKSHGSALGADEVKATKMALGLNPESSFVFPDDLLDRLRGALAKRVSAERTAWETSYDSWRANQPEHAALLDRILMGELPTGFDGAFPTYEVGSKAMATRAASGQVIDAIAGVMPELWGGSADLAESNNTTIKNGLSFLPVASSGGEYGGESPYGRIVHFGIREHAMGAVLNGAAVGGILRPFGGTFLVFSDYMRGAVRLAALMQIPSTFVWTHDSIGLGEDGPTHQPIEHLWSLRAIPGLAIVRPADANETAAAWHATLTQRGPVGLILSRQALPVVAEPAAARAGVLRGGYVLADAPNLQAVLIATGSEVALALAAKALLDADGISTRVVSMPCLEWFDAQDQAYRESVIPPNVSARVAIEAGATLGWWRLVGEHGRVVGIDHFGASADAETLFKEFGFTAEHVADEARFALKKGI